ncbi:MAG: hypothetical protein B7Z15_12875, partial [Rhizobiales bacterium 32-66-8]
MILGMGSDFTDARRIARSIERFGDRFLDRIFTPAERAKADRRVRRAETYAKRFAAKEACAKALGTGLSHGVFWRDMGVVNLPSGKPTLVLTGGAAARLAGMVPDGYEPPATSYFVDVTPTNSEFYTEISWMGESGISQGFSDGTYRPLSRTSRDAMAAFLYRLAEVD